MRARQAIVDATVRRFRPIVLTALAAVLAMIPLSRSVFFGPMAVAIMGGLIVATALTAAVPAGAVRGLDARAAAGLSAAFAPAGRLWSNVRQKRGCPAPKGARLRQTLRT